MNPEEVKTLKQLSIDRTKSSYTSTTPHEFDTQVVEMGMKKDIFSKHGAKWYLDWSLTLSAIGFGASISFIFNEHIPVLTRGAPIVFAYISSVLFAFCALVRVSKKNPKTGLKYKLWQRILITVVSLVLIGMGVAYLSIGYMFFKTDSL